jgi:hypothetical protein
VKAEDNTDIHFLNAVRYPATLEILVIIIWNTKESISYSALSRVIKIEIEVNYVKHEIWGLQDGENLDFYPLGYDAM